MGPRPSILRRPIPLSAPKWPERSQHLSHLPRHPVRLCSLAIALAGWTSTHWTLAYYQEKLRDRPLTLTLHPLISELRPICLKLRPRNLECWPLNSKTWPFYSKNAAQNPNCRTNCSNLQALSLNCQPSNSTCQSNSYTPASCTFAFRDFRANRCPIFTTTASKLMCI